MCVQDLKLGIVVLSTAVSLFAMGVLMLDTVSGHEAPGPAGPTVMLTEMRKSKDYKTYMDSKLAVEAQLGPAPPTFLGNTRPGDKVGAHKAGI